MTLLEDVGVLIETASGEVAARDTASDESSSSVLVFHFFLNSVILDRSRECFGQNMLAHLELKVTNLFDNQSGPSDAIASRTHAARGCWVSVTTQIASTRLTTPAASPCTAPPRSS